MEDLLTQSLEPAAKPDTLGVVYAALPICPASIACRAIFPRISAVCSSHQTEG